MNGIRVFFAAVIVSATGCASTQSGAGGSSGFLNYNDCFYARSMTDWRPLDNRNLVVFTGTRQAYHVQLATPSMSLRFEDAIAFTDRDGRICPYGGDAIVVNGLVPDRIPIASVRRLDEGQLDVLYRSYNIAGPEIIDAPELAGEDE